MKTQHTQYSARDRYLGRRIIKTLDGWIAECERHDVWHDMPDSEREPTILNIAAFLDDYTDFREERGAK
jgi:hypothetical protein